MELMDSVYALDAILGLAMVGSGVYTLTTGKVAGGPVRARAWAGILLGSAFLILAAHHAGVRLGLLPTPIDAVLVVVALALFGTAAVKYWPTVPLGRARPDERGER